MEWNTISQLNGKKVKTVETDNESYLNFNLEDGNTVQFYHSQDCCETVVISDIVGDLSDLEDIIVYAEEAVEKGEIEDNDWGSDSSTWTFYKFSSIKGYVDIRWYGQSNGYYSESVDIRVFKTKKE